MKEPMNEIACWPDPFGLAIPSVVMDDPARSNAPRTPTDESVAQNMQAKPTSTMASHTAGTRRSPTGAIAASTASCPS